MRPPREIGDEPVPAKPRESSSDACARIDD
jgi:hypothetical protein